MSTETPRGSHSDSPSVSQIDYAYVTVGRSWAVVAPVLAAFASGTWGRSDVRLAAVFGVVVSLFTAVLLVLRRRVRRRTADPIAEAGSSDLSATQRDFAGRWRSANRRVFAATLFPVAASIGVGVGFLA
jgi:hypothetical protein